MAAHSVATALVVVVVVVAGLATAAHVMDEEMAELAKMVRDNCAAETGVEAAALERVDAGASLADVASPALKCYIKCTMETAGMFSAGRVDVDAVLALLPDAMRAHTEGPLRACGTKPGLDDCDTAFLTQLCWQAANKEQYFLI